MNKVLITGGAGFIGLHLARLLAPQTKQLVLCDLRPAADQDADFQAFLQQHPGVEYISGNLLETSFYDKLGGGYDVVYHLAAMLGVEAVEKDPIGVVRNNLNGTLNVLDWFARSGSKKIIFSSTSEVYAGAAEIGVMAVPTPESVPAVITNIFHPRSSYALSKLAGEHLVAQFGRQTGQAFTVIRYHNVYGPRMGYRHVIPQIMQRLTKGENPMIVRSPEHTRAFCYVADAAEATVALAQCAAAEGRLVHVGNSIDHVSVLELTRQIAAAMGLDVRLEPGQDQVGSVSRRCPDVSLLKELTGMEAKVRLPQGLTEMYAWYRGRLD
jgi:UDP-glucuronate decarboxylase